MPHRSLALRAPRGSIAADELQQEIEALLVEHDGEVPLRFPAEVLAEAEEAAARTAHPGSGTGRTDRTEVPFVTLDPADSTDLDQAMHLERTEDGYRVLYAIADVPFFVGLDDVLDVEARRRGKTLYLPGRRIPLHPEVLSEGAASLLPGQVTPAFVWQLDLDATGAVRGTDLERAMVRSVRKLAYDEVQEQLDSGEGHPTMHLLQEIGALRTALEAQRGGASLNVPEQDVVAADGAVHLRWRHPHPIEDANAQLSLLTGMAAAQLMLEHGAGILRTMPPADQAAVDRFRRQTEALGTPWPRQQSYGDYLRSLDWRDPGHLALLNQATSLFRGASYAAFTSADEAPEDPVQAAIAAPYAHATAPLRRLVDRFVLLVCHAHVRGEAPEPQLLEALTAIPEAMQAAAARAGSLERTALELVELAALEAWEGEVFEAAVIERREASEPQNGSGSPTRVEVQLIEPPVTAWVEMEASAGEVVRVRLASVDREARRAQFVAADGEGS